MKFKKTIAIIISLVLISTFTACSQDGPQGAVSSLFKALATYDVETMQTILTEFPNTDDCGVTYDLFSDDAYVELYKTAYPDLKYSIDKVDENEARSTITLTLSHPDFQSAYSSALYSSAALFLSDQELYEQIMQDPTADISYLVPQQIKNMYLNDNVETIETVFTLSLTKHNDVWKIEVDEQLKNLMSCNLYTITSTIANIEE